MNTNLEPTNKSIPTSKYSRLKNKFDNPLFKIKIIVNYDIINYCWLKYIVKTFVKTEFHVIEI